MKTVVFLIGYLCLGPVDDRKCVNIASQYIYPDVINCENRNNRDTNRVARERLS